MLPSNAVVLLVARNLARERRQTPQRKKVARKNPRHILHQKNRKISTMFSVMKRTGLVGIVRTDKEENR
jgi:hypothetical protein